MRQHGTGEIDRPSDNMGAAFSTLRLTILQSLGRISPAHPPKAGLLALDATLWERRWSVIQVSHRLVGEA